MAKIKVVKQKDIKDCGVCCLRSIIEYYDGFISLEKLRLDTHTSDKGTNALNLISASKKYGFDGMGVKVDSLHNDAIKLPAIAHTTLKNGLEHFVVIYKISKDKVYLMDPAKGKVIMDIIEFEDIWNNVLLLFYPKHDIIYMPEENSLISMFFKLLLKEKKLFIHIFITSVLLTIFTIASSYYFKVIIESIEKNSEFSLLKIIIIVFFLILFLKLVFNNLRERLENHLNKNIDCLLLSGFTKHIFELPLEIIVSRTNGEIMTRVNELMNIKSLFSDIIISCILDFLLMLISIPILYTLNNNLFFILLLVVIIYLIFGLITSKVVYKMAYHNIELEAEFNNTLIENINLIKSIKNLNQTSNVLRKIETSIAMYLYDNFKLMSFFNKDKNVKLGINEIGIFIINTVGFYLLYQNKITITEIITFNTLTIYFIDPLKYLIDVIPKYNYIKASFSKINEFLNLKPEILGEATYLNDKNIIFNNVSYSYNNCNNILDNISFKINSGDFALLKGSSGTGKSTICKLIVKYLNEYQGNILIGDINIKDYNLATIRDNITYISQNESLFTGTIKENILFNRIISDKDFNEVCNICDIESIANKKTMRYDTIINDESTTISGGERQRIILARALLQKREILLIDEALSEVDYELERTIINKLKKFCENKTVIYITHKKQDDLFNNIIVTGDNHGLL